MTRETVLARTATLQLSRHVHPADEVHVDPPEEVGRRWSLCLVEEYGFEVQSGGREWLLGEGAAFLCRPGAVYRCTHRHHGPRDVCLSLALSPTAVESLLSIGLRLDRAPLGVPASNRLRYLRHRLDRWHARGAEQIAGEALAGELVTAALAPAGVQAPAYRTAQVRTYAERVDAARHRLETRYAERHSLADLASEAGLSLYHFARIFRDLVGVPPHRYLLKVRLARAAALLREGVPVSHSCFRVGFDTLGHFAEAFRREFAVAPSEWARRPISAEHRFLRN